MKQAMINYVQNDKFDDLYTPEYAVTPLINYLTTGLTIWECTDFGESKITKVLQDNNYVVTGTDIVKGFDFLNHTADFHFDMIITNPPYSLKNKWLEKCYEYNKPFALLLPLTALESAERGKLFRKRGISVIILDRRVNFSKTNNNVWFNTSWFCWNLDKLSNNSIVFEKLDIPIKDKKVKNK
jgi:hypothetical protein